MSGVMSALAKPRAGAVVPTRDSANPSPTGRSTVRPARGSARGTESWGGVGISRRGFQHKNVDLASVTPDVSCAATARGESQTPNSKPHPESLNCSNPKPES